MTETDLCMAQNIDQTKGIFTSDMKPPEFSMIKRGNAMASAHKESGVARDQMKETPGQSHHEEGILKSRLPYVKPRLKKIHISECAKQNSS